jgi:hypothetical protein
MNLKLYVLPTLALSGAVVLLAPARSSEAFTLLGSSLSVNERDVRVFDNFADATANDNVTPAAQFPGQTGAELAIWKAVVEWGSLAHGDGTGDSTQPVLGSGGANFDAFWAGNATVPGATSSNIISKINTCSSGVLAYCEAPLSSGWRIRVCDSWVWNDGPGAIGGGQFDLQGVTCHEYGHALGLGHSTVNNATMFPSVGAGSTATRSIEADDIAGVQAIYGVQAAAKPRIIATVASAGTLTIHGSGFTPTSNQVWFRPAAATGGVATFDPRIIVSGLSSNGLKITVAIPATAGPGDVIVKVGTPGHSSVSNAFPTDLVGTFGTPPMVVQPGLSAVTPSAVEALIPGTARTVTLTGAALDRVRTLALDGQPIEAARWTVLDAETIALDMPQAPLGRHALAVSDGLAESALEIEVVAPAAPRLELATGEPLAPVTRAQGLELRLAGTPASRQLVLLSLSPAPSQNALVALALGAGFSQLVSAGVHEIPAAGWTQLSFARLPDPGASGVAWYAQSVELGGGLPLAVSNLQSVLILP